MERRLFQPFDITAKPTWRTPQCTTAHLLADIDRMRSTVFGLPEGPRDRFLDTHKRDQALTFIFETDLGERVGVQDEGTTREIFERLWQHPDATVPGDAAPSARLRRQQQETAGVLRALERMTQVRAEMCTEAAGDASAGLCLTPELLQDVHTQLMRDVDDVEGGAYRKNHAKPHGFNFLYTAPDMIESEQWVWTDALAEELLVRTAPLTLENTFKLAAFAMFNLVDVHPFSDGNGRMCRLVASSMLANWHPFPVHVEPLCGPRSGGGGDKHGKWRSIYIECLEACRAEAGTPGDLAALLVESSWRAWNHLTQRSSQWFFDGKVLLGTIAVTSRVPPGTPAFGRRYDALAHGRRESPGGGATGGGEAEESSSRRARDLAALEGAANALGPGETTQCALEGDTVVVLTNMRKR